MKVLHGWWKREPQRLEREQTRGFSTIAFIGDRFVGMLQGWAFMCVALGANDGFVQQDCGFSGDGSASAFYGGGGPSSMVLVSLETPWPA